LTEIHSYRTIHDRSTSIYKEKGSRFLGFAIPVFSENDIKNELAALRKSYFDARHHCYAWTLGADKSKFRANDDGEPNHSAGDPILGQIKSRNLTDVLVVVVRYFGGTKLGVGGLISAYKIAASEALDGATVVEREVTNQFRLTYPYVATPDVMKLIKDFELAIVDQNFADGCIMTVEVRSRLKNDLVERMQFLQQALKVDLKFTSGIE
jgi:uncharacterized YigZ family protein